MEGSEWVKSTDRSTVVRGSANAWVNGAGHRMSAGPTLASSHVAFTFGDAASAREAAYTTQSFTDARTPAALSSALSVATPARLTSAERQGPLHRGEFVVADGGGGVTASPRR
jgi:hypothetical protein